MRAICLILLSTSETTPGVLCPVSWLSFQEGCGEPGEGPAMVSGLEPQREVVGDELI